MKVVDMFGAQIPVLAIDFPALPELVKDGKNGYIFSTSTELFKRML
jgi:beta-1,4-mannosyltransferase